MTQSQMMIHPQRRIMKRPICKRKKTTTTIPATTPTPTPTPTTTTTLPCLPHDIIFFHILSKLPVRCLLRFNCVSKLWYNTIHHPNFHASHLTHAKSNSSLVATLHAKERGFIRFLHLDDHHHPNPNPNPNPNDNTIATLELHSSAYAMVGTWNGLICSKIPSAIEISNPSTRELLQIFYPKPTTELHAIIRIGFGVDHSMNEYKVIHLRLIGLTRGYECWVYTLGTNKWRNITATCNYQPPCYPLEMASICLSGNLFWRTNWNTRILSFDLHHEKFNLLTGPQFPQGSFSHDLFEWEGCPCLVYRRNDNLKDQVQLTLYTLKNYHHALLLHTEQQQPSSTSSAGWIKLTHMCLPLNPAIASIRFVEFDKNIYVQWSNTDDYFVLLDLKRKRLIHNKLIPLYTSTWVSLFNHVESLLSLKTFLPPSVSVSVSGGGIKVKYYSSREARHESPETKRKRHRSLKFDSNGYLIAPCWFSDIM